jgi:hypothetical protein
VVAGYKEQGAKLFAALVARSAYGWLGEVPLPIPHALQHALCELYWIPKGCAAGLAVNIKTCGDGCEDQLLPTAAAAAAAADLEDMHGRLQRQQPLVSK